MNCAHMCWPIIIFVLFLILYSLTSVESGFDEIQQFCTVKTKSGLIRGKFNRTLFDDKLYYSFKGIPFAKPPINELKFKAPQKIEPWNSTLDAFDFGNDCIQPDLEKQTYFGSNDCLYLNVFVPSECSAINTGTKLPVIFYIFGGKFSFGTARFYGPDFLMETNVIVVCDSKKLLKCISFIVHLQFSGNFQL